MVEVTCPRWRRARHDGIEVHETKGLSPRDCTRHERRDATDSVNRHPASKSSSELKGKRHDRRVLSHVGEAQKTHRSRR